MKGEIKNVFLRFMKSKKDFQMIIVTGKNKKLKRKLEKYLRGIHSDKDVRILGYTDKINKLMDIADFIITKPGGLTVAESLLKKLHICIISPIPGHEEKNANFLVNCGVAARLEENDDVDSFLNQVMYNKVRISSMGEIAGLLAKPNACRDIYNLMCKLVFKNNLKEV